MAENYRESFSLYHRVEAGSATFKRWFRAASSSTDYFGTTEDTIRYNSHSAEQYFALFWQQFGVAVVADEPRNELAAKSLKLADERVREAFMCDTHPRELFDE